MAKKGTHDIYAPKHRPGENDCHDIIILAEHTNVVNIEKLSTGWLNIDKREIDRYIQSFLNLNKRGFDFLNVQVERSLDSVHLLFRVGNNVGCIPLFSPCSGNPYANLIVTGRFTEDVGELLPLLPQPIDIRFSQDLILPYQTSVQPPLYFECAKFLVKYKEALKCNWKKFTSIEKEEPQPAGSTNWTKYAMASFDARKSLNFPNRHNELSVLHPEWLQINYVLSITFDELQSRHTPKIAKRAYYEDILILQKKINTRNIKPTKKLVIHPSDPLVIRQLKEIGNRILNSQSVEFRAWAMDFSKVYEGYVQYLMNQVAITTGFKSSNNQKWFVEGGRTSWDLKYLEPDIVLQSSDIQIAVDAKYKTHMLNTNSENNEELHETFRYDLHQLLAYSSFDKNPNKVSMLIYPAHRFFFKKQVIRNPYWSIINSVYLIGIPFGNCKDPDGERELTLMQKNKIAIDGICKIVDGFNVKRIEN